MTARTLLVKDRDAIRPLQAAVSGVSGVRMNRRECPSGFLGCALVSVLPFNVREIQKEDARTKQNFAL